MNPEPKPQYRRIQRESNPESRTGFLRLDKNECLDPELCSFFAREFQRMLTTDTLSVYPELNRLRTRVSTYCGVPEKQIFLSHGSDESIRRVFDVYARSGSTIVSLNPTYAMFSVYAAMNNCEIRSVDCDEELKHNPGDLIQALDAEVSIAVIANPNSPTGSEFRTDVLLECLAKCRELGILMLVDEAYSYFTATTMMPTVIENDNLVVTRTFSKAFGLAGCRAGFMAVSKNIAPEICKARPMYEMNRLSALAVSIVLDHEERVARYAQKVAHGRTYIEDCCAELGIECLGQSGNFITLRFPPQIKAQQFKQVALENNMLIKASGSTGTFANTVRITLGPPEVMQLFADLLAAFVEENGNG